MIPQIIFLVLMAMSLGMNLAKDGEPKKNDTWSFGWSLLANILMFGLLYWGGFFDVFGGKE